MPTAMVDLDLDQPWPPFWPDAPSVAVTVWRRGMPLGIARLHRPGATASLYEALLTQLGPLAAGEAPPPAMAKGPREPLSVIVCTCRRPQLLAACLDGLLKQSMTADEILVIDNAPEQDATRLLLKNSYPFCRYAAEPRRGIRFARNRALREANGEILAFIDDDCRPLPGWLAAIAAQFAARPLLGCCTGPVLPLELATPAQEWLEARGGFARGFRRRLFAPNTDLGPVYPLQAWMFGTGANMAFRRTVLRQIGPFAEVLPSAEDLEIFYRVLRGGFELLYEPAAVVRHRHPATVNDLRRHLFDWGWSYLAFLTQIACTDPLYRRRALLEMTSWLRYQLGQRLLGRLSSRAEGQLPLHLILLEIAGGLAGVPGYLFHRARSSSFRARPAGGPCPGDVDRFGGKYFR